MHGPCAAGSHMRTDWVKRTVTLTASSSFASLPEDTATLALKGPREPVARMAVATTGALVPFGQAAAPFTWHDVSEAIIDGLEASIQALVKLRWCLQAKVTDQHAEDHQSDAKARSAH